MPTDSKSITKGERKRLVAGFQKLSDETGIPARTLRTLYDGRKFTGRRVGHRTLLFSPDEVLSELERFAIRAVA